MVYGVLADLLLFIHVTFLKFVAVGGYLVLRWRWVKWVHLPSALLGAVMAFAGWLWPFERLETWLRSRALDAGYTLNLVDRYLPDWLHPASLPRAAEAVIGLGVLALNVYIYRRVFRRRAPGQPA